MNEVGIQVIALIIINRGEVFATTFWLCKVLSRSFEIFDCVGVINGLIENKLVHYSEKDGFKNFKLSKEGKKFLDSNFSNVIKELKAEYPEKMDTIAIFIELYESNIDAS
jgi:hypothetical protein